MSSEQNHYGNAKKIHWHMWFNPQMPVNSSSRCYKCQKHHATNVTNANFTKKKVNFAGICGFIHKCHWHMWFNPQMPFSPPKICSWLAYVVLSTNAIDICGLIHKCHFHHQKSKVDWHMWFYPQMPFKCVLQLLQMPFSPPKICSWFVYNPQNRQFSPPKK